MAPDAKDLGIDMPEDRPCRAPRAPRVWACVGDLWPLSGPQCRQPGAGGAAPRAPFQRPIPATPIELAGPWHPAAQAEGAPQAMRQTRTGQLCVSSHGRLRPLLNDVKKELPASVEPSSALRDLMECLSWTTRALKDARELLYQRSSEVQAHF